MTITLTDLQAAALRRAKAWFETGTAAQQVFQDSDAPVVVILDEQDIHRLTLTK